MKMKLSLLAASAILAIGMAGCGTESSSTSTPPAIVANALDGYILNADGCVDANNNDTCDVGEYTFKTNSTDGGYTIPAVNNTGKVIITGGTDKDTGLAFTGVLKAPKGSTVASPLTTLLADGMDAAVIAKLLNIDVADISKDYRAGTFEGTDAKVNTAALQVQAILGQITALFSAAGTTKSSAEITKEAVAALVAKTTTTTTLTTLDLTAVVAAVSTAIPTTNPITAATVATSITASIAAIPTITTLTSAVTATTTVANSTITAVQALELTKSVTLAGNTFTIGGPSSDNNATFDQNGSFGSVSVSSTGYTNIHFTLENNGGELSATPKTIDIAIVIDDANSSRELKAVLKGATITNNGNRSTITVPADAILYVNGTDSTGKPILPLAITDNTQDIFTSNINVTTFNLTDWMSRIAAQATGDFVNITTAGRYNISFYIGGNVTLGFDTGVNTANALTAPKESLTVKTSSGDKTVTGTKFTGTLVVN